MHNPQSFRNEPKVIIAESVKSEPPVSSAAAPQSTPAPAPESVSPRQRLISEPTMMLPRVIAQKQKAIINRTRIFIGIVSGALAVTAGSIAYFGTKEDHRNAAHAKTDSAGETPVSKTTVTSASAAKVVDPVSEISSAHAVPSATVDLDEPSAEPAPQVFSAAPPKTQPISGQNAVPSAKPPVGNKKPNSKPGGVIIRETPF